MKDFNLISKAKRKEDLTEEEQETLGTIQAALQEGIEKFKKGTISAEELNEALNKMKKELREEEKKRKAEELEEEEKKRKKENEEREAEDKKRDQRIKEAADLIEEVRKVVSELAGEVEEEKKKKSGGYRFGGDSEFAKTMRESFMSEKFKAFTNNNQSTNSGEFELKNFNKAIIRKGPVSFENNYNGNVIPAYQSDIVVTETPLQRLSLRDFMNVIDASEEEFTSYAFTRIYDINRAAAAMSENGELPEGSFKVKEVICETHRIGWHLPVSKRMLRKLRILENKILSLLPSGMLRQENFQLIYGDNSDTNFAGIQELCPDESALISHVYEENAAGKVKSIESYDGGAKTKVNFAQGYAKMQTGMKVVFEGFANANMNAELELLVYNDSSIVVPVAYVAEADSSVQANVKFKIDNVWGKLVMDANMGDALQVLISYLNFDRYMPNLIVMNPLDYCAMSSMKDRNGRKLIADYVQVNNGVAYFGGIIPIAQLDCITKGRVLVGDFMNGCELLDTQRGFMEFAEDVKTKLTNQVESIISEEVIFAVTVPDAFVYANIETLTNAVKADATLTTDVRIVSPLVDDGTAINMNVY